MERILFIQRILSLNGNVVSAFTKVSTALLKFCLNLSYLNELNPTLTLVKSFILVGFDMLQMLPEPSRITLSRCFVNVSKVVELIFHLGIFL